MQLSASIFRVKVHHNYKLNRRFDVKRSRDRRARAQRLRVDRRRKQSNWR